MKFPKKISIGGYEFKIIYPYQFTERMDIDGRIDFGLGHILLDNRDGLAHEDHLAIIFWHEIMHGISHVFCMDKVGAVREDEEVEQIINALGHGIHQVLKDNFEPLVPKRKKR